VRFFFVLQLLLSFVFAIHPGFHSSLFLLDLCDQVFGSVPPLVRCTLPCPIWMSVFPLIFA